MAAHKKINVLLSVKGAVKDRSVRLAELEVWRKRMQAEPEVEAQLHAKVVAYFDTFATKACCHEDLLPYLRALSSDSRSKLSAALKERIKPLPAKNEAELRTYISIAKITRAVQAESSLSEGSEAALAAELVARYVDGLSVGKDLPDTEMQPADDLALLGAQALLSAYRLSGGKLVYLFQVIGLLEFGLTKSSKGYQLRMLLIRSYTLAGALDRALIHYGLLGLKSVQADTLSHLVSERCSAFSATGKNAKAADEATYKMAVRTLSTAQAIYEENAGSTPEMIGKALEHGIYSRVEEFVEFGEALERSLQRQVVRLEEARSHLHRRGNFADDEQRKTFEAAISNSVASVRADLAAGLSDQRDYSVLVNYQPMATPSVEELTQVGQRQDAGWVRSIALTLADDQGGVGIEEQDLQTLTAREKALVQLMASLRSGSFEASRLLELLEAVKTTTRTVVDVVGGGAGGGERVARRWMRCTRWLWRSRRCTTPRPARRRIQGGMPDAPGGTCDARQPPHAVDAGYDEASGARAGPGCSGRRACRAADAVDARQCGTLLDQGVRQPARRPARCVVTGGIAARTTLPIAISSNTIFSSL